KTGITSMSLVQDIKEVTAKAIEDLYKIQSFADDILVNQTKPEFEGDYTVVLFALVKQLKKSPEALGNEIGTYLVNSEPELFTGFNVIKGFLNLSVSGSYFTRFLSQNLTKTRPDIARKPTKIVVEYSSPNTNKPLHLGHLRNNFLGWSIAEILKVNGNEVVKTCIVNDRGVHICKSMIAWELFSNGETPESTGIKGDHFVGDYYVRFSNEHKKEMQVLVEAGETKEQAERNAPIMQKTQQMLVDWENGKPEVMELWKKMNSWVYKGFDATYKRIGSDFDKIYYESETYLLGRKYVEEGLEKGVFYRKDDGSVWIDLTADGLDEKLVLRKDGTSVYITQDLGLADEKYKDFQYDQSMYIIADEQNYHMKVLKLILQKLGKPYADGIFHLSYGMVELPSGRMKSREGTVVDADDLIDEMVNVAAAKTQELGKVKDFNEEELKELYDTLAVGALKFFLIKVDPKKRMVFNPEESIDFHGFTGPFVQYTHARIRSILRREAPTGNTAFTSELLKLERDLLLLLEQYATIIRQAADEQNPSVLAMYAYNLAKTYNSFYTEHSVLNAESEEKKQLRLQLCQLTANTIKDAMGMLGIRVPERM
ncbi:MAG: arginine--tRNA ligase, partial [Cytophagaceae bacterium]